MTLICRVFGLCAIHCLSRGKMKLLDFSKKFHEELELNLMRWIYSQCILRTTSEHNLSLNLPSTLL